MKADKRVKDDSVEMVYHIANDNRFAVTSVSDYGSGYLMDGYMNNVQLWTLKKL